MVILFESFHYAAHNAAFYFEMQLGFLFDVAISKLILQITHVLFYLTPQYALGFLLFCASDATIFTKYVHNMA